MIESKLKKVNNQNLVVSGSFLALGLTGLTSHLLGNPSIFSAFSITLGVASIPLLSLEAIIKVSWKKSFYKSDGKILNKFDKTFFNMRYKNVVNKKLNSIFKIQDMTEQKYELFILALYSHHIKLNLRDVTSLKTIFKLEEISEKLIRENETKFQLSDCFYKSTSNYKTPLPDILEEDLNNSDKISVIKLKFKDYENLGMLGKNFLDLGSNYSKALMMLQNTLTKEDYRHIEIFNKEQVRSDMQFFKSFKESEDLVKNLILNETRNEHLVLLNRFFEEKESITSLCQSRMNYLTLSNKLKPTTEKKNIQRKKI